MPDTAVSRRGTCPHSTVPWESRALVASGSPQTSHSRPHACCQADGLRSTVLTVQWVAGGGGARWALRSRCWQGHTCCASFIRTAVVVVRWIQLGRGPVTWSFTTRLSSLLLREVVLSSHHFCFLVGPPSLSGWTTLSSPPLHSERSLEPPFSPWRHWVKLGCLWLSGLGGSWHSLVGARDVSSACSTQDAPMSSVPGQGGIGYSAGRPPLLFGSLDSHLSTLWPHSSLPGTTSCSLLPEEESLTTRAPSAGWKTTWTTQVSVPRGQGGLGTPVLPHTPCPPALTVCRFQPAPGQRGLRPLPGHCGPG